MSETVECDDCSRQTRLRRDGTYAAHGYTRHGTKYQCERSGTPYARHMGSFRIIKRDPNLWLCECRCGENFTGDTYEAVEQPWLRHAEAERVSA